MVLRLSGSQPTFPLPAGTWTGKLRSTFVAAADVLNAATNVGLVKPPLVEGGLTKVYYR